MTQFTEAFYPAYQGTRKAIEEKRDLCSKIPAGLTAEYAKLVQLETLWGMYCVNYIADAKTEADRTYVEAECLKELNTIMEQK